MIFLWDVGVCDSDIIIFDDIIKNSIHRVTDKRIRHLANWVKNSFDPKFSLQFIKSNIDCGGFYPFTNPWDDDELKNIYEKTNGGKIIRLSTGEAGVLTISSNSFIMEHTRIYIGYDGIIFGNMIFLTIYDLINFIDTSTCGICIEVFNNRGEGQLEGEGFISASDAVVLKCGHIFHKKCLNSVSLCTICGIKKISSFGLPKGNTCMYS